MKNSLIPTAITDKNGKQTTVHKRSGLPSPSTGKLAALKPVMGDDSSKKRQRFDSKTIKVDWQLNPYTAEPNVREGSFLANTGLTEGVFDHDKSEACSVELSVGDLYEFMRLGITKHEAAFLVRNGDTLEDLQRNPQFMAALPGSMARSRSGEGESVANVVDYLHEQMVIPAKVAALLGNGLRDYHLERTVLDEEKVVGIFKRFKYQSSTVGAETNASVTLDALLDGRLPYELFEAEYERTTLTMASDALYPRKRGMSKKDLTDAERDYLIANPDEIVTTVKALNNIPNRRGKDFVETFRSIQKHGYDNTIKYSPNLLMMAPGGGEPLGLEGAKKVRSAVDLLSSTLQGDKTEVRFNDVDPTGGYIWNRTSSSRESHDIEYGDIALMQRAGATDEQIVGYLSAGTIDSKSALAIVRGDTNASLVSGWL